MATKKLSTFGGLFAIALLLQGCPNECAGPTYVFSASARFVPEQEVLQLGDTLYLASAIPTNLLDQNGQMIDYRNSEPINGTLYVFNLQTGNTVPIGAISDFDFIQTKGDIHRSTDVPFPERVQQVTYAAMDDQHELSLSMIPKRVGTYCIALGQAYSSGLKEGDNCQQAVFEISLTNPDQHLQYMENFQGYPVTETESRTMYCFQVVE